MTDTTRTTAGVPALAAIAVPTASASVADKPVDHAPATEDLHPTGGVPASRLGVAPQDPRTSHAIDAAPATTSALRTLATPPTAGPTS